MSARNQKTAIQVATTSQVDNIDDDPPQSKNIYDKIYDAAGHMAATDFGQFTIEKIDKMLSVLEKTAKWSLPQNEYTVNNVGTAAEKSTVQGSIIAAPPLERPCSWVPFLSLIIFLRLVRITLSFGAVLIGNKPITPSTMVYFIQQRRRKLRAVKYHGLRALRIKKQTSQDHKTRGVLGKLSSVFNMVVCRPGRFQDTPAIPVLVKKTDNHTSTTVNKEHLNSNQKRLLDSSEDVEYESDEDLTADKLLDKYANEASDAEDLDFVPENVSEDESLSSGSEEENSSTEEHIENLNKLKNQLDNKHFKENSNSVTTTTTTQSTIVADEQSSNGTTNQNEINSSSSKKEEIKQDQLKSDNLVVPIIEQNSSFNANVSQNSTEEHQSPKIAQNGNILEDEKFENFYDPIDVCSDIIDDHTFIKLQKGQILTKFQVQPDQEQQLLSSSSTTIITTDGIDSYYSPIGSPINTIENNISHDHEIDTKKSIMEVGINKNSTVQEDAGISTTTAAAADSTATTTTTDDDSNQNVTAGSNQTKPQQSHNSHTTNKHHHNNKKHHNNIYYKYNNNKGKRAH